MGIRIRSQANLSPFFPFPSLSYSLTLSFSIFLSLSFFLSISLAVFLSIYFSRSLFIYIFLLLSFYLPISLSLPLYLFLSLFSLFFSLSPNNFIPPSLAQVNPRISFFLYFSLLWYIFFLFLNFFLSLYLSSLCCFLPLLFYLLSNFAKFQKYAKHS